MNKLKQLYKTTLFNWNDNTLYKTSLTKNNTLFKYHVCIGIGLVESLALFCIGGELLEKLAVVVLMVAFNLTLITTQIYKGVADTVADTVAGNVEEQEENK